MRSDPVSAYEKVLHPPARRTCRSESGLTVQIAFGAIAVLVGAQFVLWVRSFESGDARCGSRVPTASRRGCRSRR